MSKTSEMEIEVFGRKVPIALIEASKLNLDGGIMNYYPPSLRGMEFRNLLRMAIKKEVRDFYIPVMDPSVDEEGKIFYEAGNKPAIGYSYSWWERKAKEFCPEHRSRLGTKYERMLFLGILITKLVESGCDLIDAWKCIFVDSSKLGHYSTSKYATHYYLETTGSRRVCDFYDLGNTYKILAKDEDTSNYWLAGGSYNDFGYHFPISSLLSCEYNIIGADANNVGWLVFEK